MVDVAAHTDDAANLFQKLLLEALRSGDSRGLLHQASAWAERVEQLLGQGRDLRSFDGQAAAFLWHLPPHAFASLAATSAPDPQSHFASMYASSGTIPVVDFGDPQRPDLPEAATSLLAAGMPALVRNSGLWPAAQQRWSDQHYLSHEFDNVDGGMTVLGNTAHRRDFSYWKDDDGYGDGAAGGAALDPKSIGIGIGCRGGWNRPSVASVKMRMSDFLRHRGLEETEDIPLVQPAGVAARDACLCMHLCPSIFVAPCRLLIF